MLDIQLFGPLQATWRGKPLTLPRRQQTGLLWAYLLLHPGPVARDRAAFTLWPDHQESEARAELRRHLYFLSRWLSQATDREDWLTRARGQIAWSAVAESAVDVRAFRAAHALIPTHDATPSTPAAEGAAARTPLRQPPLALGWSTDAQTRQALAISATQYRDDLLPGVYAPWLAPIRERLQRQLLELLAALARAEHAAGDTTAALRTARRLVERDGLREESHRLLMRLLAARGDRAAALAQFERCKELLHRELDVPPAPPTIRLMETLRAEASATASVGLASAHEGVSAETHDHGPSPAPRAGGGRIAESRPAAPKDGPGALPASPAPLFGRADDLARLEALLQSERLVTIIGPGGIGKTAVALACAHRQAGQGTAYVRWIDLTAVGPEDSLAEVLRRARRSFEADARRDRPATTQRQWLLVLDNCEHRLAEVARLAEQLLAASPSLRVLATSREGLRCPSELAWRLSPLAAEDSAAIALFIHRARRKRPDWQPTPLDRQRMATICRRLDGLPLAIEMAAARTDTLGLEALELGLRDSLDMLGEGARTAPQRQRTLRATFDWSERLLEPELRLLLARLAVFADHFGLAAATAVAADTAAKADTAASRDTAPTRTTAGAAAAPPSTATALARLVDASLIEPIATDRPTEARFRLLHTIRPFALERAAATGEAEGARYRHATHYLALAEEAVAALESLAYRGWLPRIDPERRVLLVSFEHVLERGDYALALRFAAALWGYWNMRSAIGAERRWLEELLARTTDADPGARAPALLGAGVLAYGAGDLQQAADRCRAARAAFEMIGDEEGLTRASAYLAHVAHMRGDDEEAAEHCATS